MPYSKKYLILIVGPTGVGKTDLSIKIAKNFRTEIVSCDSRQFYRELEIGTAKPSSEELSEVKHHLINSLSIEESYDVRRFETDALAILEGLFADRKFVVMTGGSGLFADAIAKGFDHIPDLDPDLREELIAQYEELGIAYLQNELEQVDPDYFEIVDQKNPQRLMRALEVYRGTGKPFSSFRTKAQAKRPFEVIWIGLELERDLLYQRIDRRMDGMIKRGLFEEAEGFFDKKSLNALQTVGYSEIFRFLEGEYDKEEAIRLLKRNSRRYAKRQLTWFKKNKEITWFTPLEVDEVISHVESQAID
ncbi:tRNA (adenosine(37)-N6)-dimethylallyltransferase MiaA [Algoriphagus namhaensis]|uniref:tRNA dimethylallyltransferase n=1 Tax=Algoriphagus namhaensis TaxID=915353 RepID=A0ABV8AUW5_9BACT